MGWSARARLTGWLALGLAAAACTHRGQHESPHVDASPPDAGEPEVAPPLEPGTDPGFTAIHRLNNREYDNTIRDLLGVEAHARETFLPDEKGYFDNEADVFTINDARYEAYYQSAQAIAQQVFADATLKGRVISCAPAGANDAECAARSIRAFGPRAWRRPLADEEVERLLALYAGEVAAGHDFTAAMQTVVTAMLSSPKFLYRIEHDDDPASKTPHAVGPYELASRLSYWLWSTMPDDQLFKAAASGELSQPAGFGAQLTRLLDDPRSQVFVESFYGQWLGQEGLLGHQVEPTTFPEWDEPLRVAMAREMLLYFDEFLRKGRPFDQFLNADVNFVNARLARHYEMDTTGLGDAAVRVEDKGDHRKGYLGLAGFLTTTSLAHRSDPRNRARWVREWVLCDPEPNDIALNQLHLSLYDFTGPTTFPSPTLREEIEATLARRDCHDCHATFDPIALGLSGFDAIGRFPDKDKDGNPIDASGTLADGRPFRDELELADLLATDQRVLRCASKMAYIYALGRYPTKADEPYIDGLLDLWRGKKLALRALLEQIAASEPFQSRRGEGMP